MPTPYDPLKDAVERRWGGVKNLEGVALRVTGTVPLPLGDPSTQRSMNRVVAQQELERQNFRVRGSRLATSMGPERVTPVTFPPGRLRLATRPNVTGSP